MAVLSLQEAAEQAGRSKVDIWLAIQEGMLSAQRADEGGFAIDPAELFRVFEYGNSRNNDTPDKTHLESTRVPRGRSTRSNLTQPLQRLLREDLFRLWRPWALAARWRAFAAGEARQRPTAPAPRPARRPPRSPNRRASIERRRRQAASGALPPALAAQFTQGELAALAVVARQFQQRQVCVLCVDQIAALAGVCGRLVQKTLRAAEAVGLVHIRDRRIPGQISLPNVVTIVSKEWSTGSGAVLASIG
jgi:hypothetical protein